MLEDWEDTLGRFAPAPPGLAAKREIQRRTETKFVVPVAALAEVLPALTDGYVVLQAGSRAAATYRSLYFDTADLDLFHAHRRGRRVRQKVRIRHYPDRRVSFLEVKMRFSDARTVKVRRERPYESSTLSADDAAFVRAHSSVSQELVSQAWIGYRRVTLLSLSGPERVTVDVELSFVRGTCAARLRNVAVVEVKQPRLDRATDAMTALRKAGWRQGWASKYCISIAFASPEVRAHRLLAGLRTLKAMGTWAT